MMTRIFWVTSVWVQSSCKSKVSTMKEGDSWKNQASFAFSGRTGRKVSRKVRQDQT